MATSPNQAPVDRPVAELQKCGFTIKPWWAASAIAEMLGGPQRDMRMFERGTVHGLLEVSADSLNVVALANDKPNNGHFGKAVARLERAADNLGVTLRIVEFWNDRLRCWFVRRGYESGRHPQWAFMPNAFEPTLRQRSRLP
jgi:hypothetical protein